MRSLFVILACLIASFAKAQDVAAFSITQQDGLPSNTVYNLFQSNDGFMWIATENGLARYNGFAFRPYENTAVRSRAVGGLLEDNNGKIWTNNFFGEILLIENDTLKKLNSWEQYYKEGFPFVTHINDTLVINTYKHAYRYLMKREQWFCIDSLFAQNTSLVFGHNAIDRQGRVWFCFGMNNESYLTTLSKNFKPIKISNQKRPLHAVPLRIVFWNDKIFLFEHSLDKLFEINGSSVADISDQFNFLNETRSIVNLGDSLLAFIGTDGAHLLNKQHQWQHILPKKNISCVTTDREGGLWLGTLNEGIFYVPMLNTRLFSKKSCPLFTKLASTKENLFAGGYDGSVSIFSSKSLVRKINAPSAKEVQSIFIDSALNQLLVFTDKLYFFDLKNFLLTKSIATVSTKKIVDIGDSYVLATSYGVVSIDKINPSPKIIFPNQRIATVGYDKSSNTLWIGAQKGLYTFDLTSRQIKQWADSTQNSPGVSCIVIHGDGIILGTLNDGIYFLKDNKLVHKITSKESLPSNRISALDIDNNTLWAGTEKGIAAIDLHSRKLSSIDYTKGLSASEVYDLTIFNNHLWASHPEGLQQFPLHRTTNKQRPKIHVTSMTTNGISINTFREIELQPTSQQLTIHFDVSNNLRSRGNTVIRYRIKGLANNQWQETTLASPIANYLSVPSGNYTLEAMAVNEDGVSSINTIAIPIRVLAPYWKQTWFLIATVLLVIAIAIAVTYWRLAQLHKQNQLNLLRQNQEHQLRIARLTSIRAQMNPHFIFNTLSSIQGKILNGQWNEANDNIQSFAQLLRKVLEFSSREAVSLQEEIEVLQTYLSIEKDRFDGHLDYEIRTDEQLKNEYVRIPSLLTQPFVENALRHGLMHKNGNKNLVIDFSIAKDLLVITVDDNGIGRRASEVFNQSRKKNHQSFAIGASQQRIDLLNASRERKIDFKIIDKHNERGMATGTTVVINLPLDHELD